MKSRLFNIDLDIMNHEEFFGSLDKYLCSASCHSIFFLNAHCFNIAQSMPEYLDAINSSDLLLNDGIGIKIACKFSGIDIKENMNGTDLIPRIIGYSALKKKKIFLFGGEEGIANRAKAKIGSLYPDAEISGVRSGFFNENIEKEIISEIDASGAEVLILGMGVPKQELWANKNKANLANVKVIISGGAILDFLADKFPRAPLFMRKMGMEWLFRLLNEPKRLAKRYIYGNALFLFSVIKMRLRKKKS